MDKKKVILGAAAVAALSSMAAEKAYAVAATMTAQAIIQQAINATFTLDMHFGNLSTTTNSGTVALDVGGGRTPGGAGGLNTAGGALHHAASLTVTAAKSAVLALSVATLPAILTHATAADTMQVTAFSVQNAKGAQFTKAITATGAGAAQTFAMPTTGTAQTFAVGGTLLKGAGAHATGTYTTGTAVTWNIVYN